MATPPYNRFPDGMLILDRAFKKGDKLMISDGDNSGAARTLDISELPFGIGPGIKLFDAGTPFMVVANQAGDYVFTERNNSVLPTTITITASDIAYGLVFISMSETNIFSKFILSSLFKNTASRPFFGDSQLALVSDISSGGSGGGANYTFEVSDCNLAVNPGFYSLVGTKVNTPNNIQDDIGMFVSSSKTETTQILVDLTSNVWTRTFNGSIWGQWTTPQNRLFGSMPLDYFQYDTPPLSGMLWWNPGSRILFRLISNAWAPAESVFLTNNYVYSFGNNSYLWGGFGMIQIGGQFVAPAQPPSSTITLSNTSPTYTIDVNTPQDILVSSNISNGSIILPNNLPEDQNVTVHVGSGSNSVQIHGGTYNASQVVFVFFSFSLQSWTVSLANPIPVKDFSDISVQEYSGTATVVQIGSSMYYAITGLTTPVVNDMIFLNNSAKQTDIGIYRISNLNPLQCYKITTGTNLNIVRVNGGKVYYSQYDGISLASLTFKELGSGQAFTTSINSAGHLILTFSDLSSQDAGLVVGAQGANGAPGTPGTNGISTPVNFCLFKTTANGVLPYTDFGWITNLKVTNVILSSSAADISVTIGGTVYNKITLIGVTIPTGTKMTNLDITISAGYNSANAIIIFSQS
jgi:hypothetical protein